MDEELSYLGFSHFFGIGPLHFRSLLSTFGSASKAYRASPDELENLLGSSLTDRFVGFRRNLDLKRLYEAVKKQGISVLIQSDNRYPDSLRSLTDPPICIYVKGDCSLLQDEKSLFAIVGTRNPTLYGVRLARHFASTMAENGFVIVSGMALGVDALAHGGAMDSQGKTVAVLGCGVDIIYPPSHRALYQKILATGGAVVSEFPPGHTVRPGLFVVRNRIISGLSRGLLVIEGTDKSGTLTTAKYAAEQGKSVFAPPSPITSRMSRAPNLLLQQGAVLVMDIKDILREFGMRQRNRAQTQSCDLSNEEKEIIRLLEKEDCSFDMIILALRLPPHTVSTALSRLELYGVIEKDDSGNYHLHLG